MAVEPNIKRDIDNSIRNRMSEHDFEVSISRIITSIFAFHTANVGTNIYDNIVTSLNTVMNTSAYLSYVISRELIRSENSEEQRRYAEAATRVLNNIYNNPVFSSIFSQPTDLRYQSLRYGLEFFSNIYFFHSILQINGIRFDLNDDDALNCLRSIVGSTYGGVNFYIRDRATNIDERQTVSLINVTQRSTEFYILIGPFQGEGNNIEYRSATWNMQGYSADKWRNGVAHLAANNHVVCLQEVGQGVPSSANFVREHNTEDQFGVPYSVNEYNWNIGTSQRPLIYTIFFFNVERLRVNLAVVVANDRDFIDRIPLIIADGIDSGIRPGLGIRLLNTNGAVTFFSFHAISNGGVNSPRMIREISRHTSTPFAVLGDFNRDPRPTDPIHPNRRGEWVSPRGLARIAQAAGDTHGAGANAAMLDYAAVNGTDGAINLGIVEDLQDSDHRSVTEIFTFLRVFSNY